MIASRWHWLFCLLLALSVSALLHGSALLKHFHDSDEKIGILISGPRTDVGDNYYYFTMLRHAHERFLAPSNSSRYSDGNDSRNVNAVTNSYATALFAGHLLFRMAGALTSDSRGALLLTSILHSAVLTLCFIAFVSALSSQRTAHRYLPFLSVLVGIVFIDAFGNSVYFGIPYWDASLLSHYSNTTRLVNPNLFWAAGLLAASCIIQWLKSRGVFLYAAALALSGLTGLFSISVGATLALGLCLAATYETLSSRKIRWDICAIALAAISGVAWGYFQIFTYSTTSLGQELRHGQFLGFNPRWHFLLLLALIPPAWRMLGKERSFVTGLILSASVIGLLCDSFNLGSRLWLRGAVIYPWAIAVVIFGHLLLLSCSRFSILPNFEQTRTRLPVALFIVMMAMLAQKPDVITWKGFIDREKWHLLDWIDKNLPLGSVVTSPDIEDSFLLPIYTGTKPLFSMYGITSRTRDQELRRYFYNMKLYGQDRRMLENILAIRQDDVLKYLKYVMGKVPEPLRTPNSDAIIFLELVLYYSYIQDLRDLMSNPSRHETLKQLLLNRSQEADSLRFTVDYAIIVDSLVPPVFKDWPLVYANGKFAVARNPGPLPRGLAQ